MGYQNCNHLWKQVILRSERINPDQKSSLINELNQGKFGKAFRSLLQSYCRYVRFNGSWIPAGRHDNGKSSIVDGKLIRAVIGNLDIGSEDKICYFYDDGLSDRRKGYYEVQSPKGETCFFNEKLNIYRDEIIHSRVFDGCFVLDFNDKPISKTSTVKQHMDGAIQVVARRSPSQSVDVSFEDFLINLYSQEEGYR